MRIAIVQTAVQDGAPQINAERMLARLAATSPADFYLLPELWSTGYLHASWPEAAKYTPSIVEKLAAFSRQRNTWVAGSLISFNEEQKLVNRCWMLGPAGQTHIYDKVHLFPLMDEHKYLAGGLRRATVPVAGVMASLAICFDLRFPEMFRAEAVAGANLFVVPSEWPHPRGATLRLLATARAAENQAYLALCNRVGSAADGTRFCGGSALIGPDGTVLCDAGEEDAVVYGDVLPEMTARAREAIPVLAMQVRGVDF